MFKKANFENKLCNFAPLEGYSDSFFRDGINPFINFEEILVNYATMKILNEKIENYPDTLEKIFKGNYDEKKLLLFIDDEMPNVRKAILKLINEYD